MCVKTFLKKTKTGIGIAITLSVDELSDDWQAILGFPGELWVRALKLMVLPLIVLLMVVLPSRVSDIGSKGTKTLGFYMLSSIVAACEGLIWVNIINPGEHGEVYCLFCVVLCMYVCFLINVCGCFMFVRLRFFFCE